MLIRQVSSELRDHEIAKTPPVQPISHPEVGTSTQQQLSDITGEQLEVRERVPGVQHLQQQEAAFLLERSRECCWREHHEGRRDWSRTLWRS